MDWEAFATTALRTLLQSEEAVVRPEAEAQLGENGWCSTHVDRSLPTSRGPQPHHLTTAHRRLVSAGELEDDSASLSSMEVTAWTHVDSKGRVSTSARRAAAKKRRLYRTFLGWTGNQRLCGDVAEEVVDATLRSLAGSRIWLPSSAKPGQITQLQGTPVSVGGPLDHAGYWAEDPDDPTAGWIPFAVEVKNIRGWIYPWDPEMWDLLAKVASFPDVVPVLVARKMNYISFRMLKDLGGLGTQIGSQLFADRGTTRASIDADRFHEVTSGLNLRDCKLVDPTSPNGRLQKFFGETAYKVIDGASLAANSQARWQAAAPIVARFAELRDDTLPTSHRTELWREFGEEVERAGLMEGGGWVAA